MPALKMVHAVNPREVLNEKTVAFISRVKPLGARVLVATYLRPPKTAGGIIIPDKSRDEDRWQGKVGLVVAFGPLAFTEDADHRWGDVKPKIGDWVLTNIGDTRRLDVGDNPCRFVEDVNIQAIIDDPDMVW